MNSQDLGSRSLKATTFKDAFCQYHKCAPEKFVQKVLFRSFLPHVLPFALLFYIINTRSMRCAIEAIEQIAFARNEQELLRAISDYRYRLKMAQASPWIGWLRIRISRKRLMALFMQVNQSQAPALSN